MLLEVYSERLCLLQVSFFRESEEERFNNLYFNATGSTINLLALHI